MRTEPVIAIDGPAGSGKSTVARIISARTGMPLLDTGAMYRCAALSCLREGINLNATQAVIQHSAQVGISFLSGNPQRVLLNDQDVTDAIRTLEVGQAASQISTYAEVRADMVHRQQEIVARGGTVLEGRDVTTVVAPDAEVKVFLTASIEERARRRWLELRQKGEETRLQAVVLDVVERDHRDYTRTESPLQLAEDAVIIESFGITPEEVADRVLALIPR